MSGDPTAIPLHLDPREQRKGYGTSLLIAAPKPECGRIVARIHPLNKASKRTFTRAGFVNVGSERAHWLIYELIKE